MVTGPPLDVYSEIGIRSFIGSTNGLYGDDLENDQGFLLRDHRQREPNDLERELNLYRSGSAPPTLHGSLTAITGISDFSRGRNGTEFSSEDELRSDPAYLSYYYSNINQNPRLPPPTLSREDWRFARRFQAGDSGMGRIGDRRKGNCSDEIGSESLFSLQPGLSSQRGEFRGKLTGFSGLDLGNGQRTFSDVLQDDLGYSISISGSPSHPASASAFDDGIKMLGSTESHHPHLHQNMGRVQSISASAFNSFASRPRSTTPEHHPLNAFTATEKKTMNGPSSSNSDQADLVATLSGMSLSKNGVVDEQTHLQLKMIQQEIDLSSDFLLNGQHHRKKHPYLETFESGHLHPYFSENNGAVMNLNKPMMPSPLGADNLLPLYENAATISAIGRSTELQDLNNMGNHRVEAAVQMPLMDPLYFQYLQPAEYAATFGDPSLDINYMGNSYVDLLGLQKAYLGAFFQPEKLQFHTPLLANSGGLDCDIYGSPIGHNRRNMCFPSATRNLAGGVVGSWHLNNSGNMHESFSTSLLEEFKGNRIKCSELTEIAGHVIEFSLDQYGSRFIQQKLETATTEEKNMIFQEIIPQALSLTTDVFGNYVIQKFFEHGIASQRRELANKLFGNVLTLSLQMYGCRVIQKAIEVVDFYQQTKMVSELEGHVMRCVRDQNGNHVIQKCIECIPENAIQFITSSFYDHVVTLSTHPYGCRVIQRVLEHCNDSKTQCIMMDEILQNVSMLAQDQYGNYVIQHVLEHGKPHERSAIIKQLAGQIVHMSQQKFASNVVEKCLTFGGPMERQILVAEMLGSTDENEPLQAMMKDQFANYVVQKVLETCDNQQLELILSRIKVHLNALKKYTYGKHIVARVEKLVAAGERRIRVQSPYGR